ELLLDGLRVDTCRHEVVELVAQRADELGGERLVQYADRLLAIELVVGRDRPLGNVLACALAKGLDLLQMGHRLVSCHGEVPARGARRLHGCQQEQGLRPNLSWEPSSPADGSSV